jgi:hypothetical protein
MNDARILFLGFFDATAFQLSARHDDNIKPVPRHRNGRKNGSDLEENSGLGRSDNDLTATQDQFSQAVVQLDDFCGLAFQKLLDGELATGMGLVAVLESTTTARAGPKGLGGRTFRLPFPHVFRPQPLWLSWPFLALILGIHLGTFCLYAR